MRERRRAFGTSRCAKQRRVTGQSRNLFFINARAQGTRASRYRDSDRPMGFPIAAAI